jgi:hypothetical protein
MRGKTPAPIEEVPPHSPTTLELSQRAALPSDIPSATLPQELESNEFRSGINDPKSQAKMFSSVRSSAMPTNSFRDRMDTDMMYAYFDFVEAEAWNHIAPEDFKFLECKGCFHLPARPVLNEFVREYFLHVHPVLPVINEQEFWNMYYPRRGQTPQFKIPLFVFRAMLFVSCSVSYPICQRAGM